MLNRTRFAGLLGIFGLFFCGGCLTQGVKAEKDKFALIQPGVTSRALIEQSFGPPDAVDTVGDHTVLIYSYMKASFGLLGIAGALDYDRQAYQFVLDKSGRVDSCVLREYQGSSGIFSGPGKEKAVSDAPAALGTPTTAP